MRSGAYSLVRVTGQFSETVMQRALADAARQLDVDYEDAELLHMANNALYALPGAGLVIRITRSTRMHGRVHKVARLGQWLKAVDAPAIRPAGEAKQPLSCNGLLATVWKYEPPREGTPSVEDLGSVLKDWHKLRAPDGLLPRWNPVVVSRQRLNDAEDLAAEDREYLLAWCDELEPRIEELNRRYPDSVVHGDAHVGNLLRDDSGRIILCDFDSTSLGPPQVDLAAVAAGEIWFDQGGLHERLAAAYGYDVTTDPDWPLLRSARELAFVVGGVPLLKSTPGVADEFAMRLRSIRDGDKSTAWTPYAWFGNGHKKLCPHRKLPSQGETFLARSAPSPVSYVHRVEQCCLFTNPCRCPN